MASIETSGWFLSRPPIIQEAIRRYPPDRKYLMRETNQIVTIYSYSEPLDYNEGDVGAVTITVNVLGYPDMPDEIQVLFQRRVFGVQLSDIEPLDAP